MFLLTALHVKGETIQQSFVSRPFLALFLSLPRIWGLAEEGLWTSAISGAHLFLHCELTEQEEDSAQIYTYPPAQRSAACLRWVSQLHEPNHGKGLEESLLSR